MNIKKEFRKGILFIRIKGDLNKNTITKFKHDVEDLIIDMKICNVVFNLSSLNSIDISGVKTLLHTYNVCKRMHGISMLCGLNDNVRKTINHSKNNMFQIKDEFQALNLIKV